MRKDNNQVISSRQEPCSSMALPDSSHGDNLCLNPPSAPPLLVLSKKKKVTALHL